jgi:hypothetical protein
MTPRSAAQRKADVLQKLATEVDLWVASADAAGDAYLIPLSYYWDGERLTMATPVTSRTARNLQRAGSARVALGPTRDVVIIEGPITVLSTADIDAKLGDAHATHTGFDPRTLADPYLYLQLVPRAIQAWREADELAGRTVMRDGRWLVG